MPKALVFDSGVGGLSIVAEIQKLLPGLEVRYLMDNACFPYGVQQDDVLLKRIVALCEANSEDCALIVIACNTASTIALPALREQLNIPVIGVVPAIKTASSLSHSKHIGLLATPATVDRPYTDQLIADHAQHTQVTRLGSCRLVELAEDYFLTNEINHAELKQVMEPISEQFQLDQLVLGCTHFPLLKSELQQILPTINLVDSGEAIARRALHLLEETQIEINDNCEAFHSVITTAMHPTPEKLALALNRIGHFQSIELANVPEQLANRP